MATKELTKDSITGAIFDSVEVRAGEHWMKDEDVIEVRLKQDEDSNSTNIYVLSLKAAYHLRLALGERLSDIERHRVARQPLNWPDFAD